MAAAPRATSLIGIIAVFVVLGFPLVYIIWEAINAALSFEFGEIRWVLVVPALLLFTGLLVALARVVRRLTETP